MTRKVSRSTAAKQPEMAGLLLLVMVALIVSALVLGSSLALLPDAPAFPTPTPPKGIDLPDSRSVPAR